MAQFASAQSIPKPSIPEFTVKFVDNSYNLPPTFGTDPYTGKEVITQAEYHLQNKSIVLAIKNQPFVIENYILFYNFRWKGHFADSWSHYPGVEEYIQASDSSYTIFTYGLVGNNATMDYFRSLDISAGGQVDFQVQAFRGYSTTVEGPFDPLFHKPTYQTTFTGEKSGWSNTQTITIPDLSLNSTLQNTEIPNDSAPNGLATVPLSLLVAVVAIFVLIIAALLLVLFRKRRTKL